MPLIKYQCLNGECGNLLSKLYRKGPDVEPSIVCKKCGGRAERILSPPASTSKITIDNGVQARAVEIHPNIAEINENRAKTPVDRGD